MRHTRVNALTLAGAVLFLASSIGAALALITRNSGLATISFLGVITGAAFLAGGWISA